MTILIAISGVTMVERPLVTFYIQVSKFPTGGITWIQPYKSIFSFVIGLDSLSVVAKPIWLLIEE